MNDEVIEVYPVGTLVHFTTGIIDKADVTGTITTVRLQGRDYVDYEVSFWNNGDRKTAWVHPSEFTATQQSTARIGFKNGE